MSDDVQRQNSDGSWSPDEPIPMQGWKARLEVWCQRRGYRRFAKFFAWLDERGLG
jgi:hypothetical protein